MARFQGLGRRGQRTEDRKRWRVFAASAPDGMIAYTANRAERRTASKKVRLEFNAGEWVPRLGLALRGFLRSAGSPVVNAH